MMKIPEAWLAGKKVLTPAEVRKMEAGSSVWIHKCYGKRGEHVFVKATVIQYGKTRKLKYSDWRGNMIIGDIKTAENIAYTADKPF